MREEFRKITAKPVAAAICTHFHPGHTLGVKAFADAAGQTTMVGALNAAQIRVTTGTRADVLKFFGYFEPSPTEGIALTVR